MAKIKRGRRRVGLKQKQEQKQIVRQTVTINVPAKIGKTTARSRGKAIKRVKQEALMSRLTQPIVPQIFNNMNPSSNSALEQMISHRFSNINNKLNQVLEDNARLKAQAIKLQEPVRRDAAGGFIITGEDQLARQQRLDAIVQKINANEKLKDFYVDLEGNLRRINEISTIDRISDSTGQPVQDPKLESELESLAEQTSGVSILPEAVTPMPEQPEASAIEIKPSMPVFSPTPQEPETFVEEPTQEPTFEAQPMGELTETGAKPEEIEQPEAVKPVEEPKSVTDEDIRKAITKIEQLTKTLRKKNIGRGQLVEIYTLAGEELPDKLIRAKRQKKLEALEKLLPVLEAKLGTPQQEPKTIEERPAGFVKRPKPVISLPPTRT